MKASWCALAGAVVLAMAACSQVGSPDTASSPRASRERSSPRAQTTTVPKVVPGGGGKGNGITLPEDLHLRYRVRSSTGDPGWVETDILKSDFRVRFLDEDNRPQLELIYLNGRYFFCEHSAAYCSPTQGVGAQEAKGQVAAVFSFEGFNPLTRNDVGADPKARKTGTRTIEGFQSECFTVPQADSKERAEVCTSGDTGLITFWDSAEGSWRLERVGPARMFRLPFKPR